MINRINNTCYEKYIHQLKNGEESVNLSYIDIVLPVDQVSKTRKE